jgi:hypothetical protein
MLPFAGRENDLPDLRPQQSYSSGANHTGNNIPQAYSNGLTSNMSPLGMDLGEFMLEGDIEFMDQLAGMGQLMAMRRNMSTGGNISSQDPQNLGVNEATEM